MLITAQKESERADWEQNHTLILKAYEYFLLTRNVIPTANQLAKKTKLSIQTVSRHLRSIRENKDARRERMAPALDLALKGVARNVAVTGDAKGAKFLAQYYEDWVETRKIDYHNSSPFGELQDSELDTKLLGPLDGTSKTVSLPPGTNTTNRDTVAGDDTESKPAGENPAP